MSGLSIAPYFEVVQLRMAMGICKVSFFFFFFVVVMAFGVPPFRINCLVAAWRTSWPRIMPKLAECVGFDETLRLFPLFPFSEAAF